METDRLRNWLGLGPGAWPPAEGELLGPRGSGDGHARAMELMELLRPHQLRHPELVTEGMNRLAQALIAWESPVVLDAEVIETRPALVLPTATAPRKRRSRKRVAPQDVTAVPEVAAPAGLAAFEDRRRAYRRLVNLRRWDDCWRLLGPYFGVPSNDLPNSTEILGYLQAIEGVRKCDLRDPGRLPASCLCREVVRHQATLSLLRSFQPLQRQRLATDWALTAAQIQAEMKMLQDGLRNTKPRPRIGQRWRSLWRSEPAWLLLPVFAAAAVVALLRTLA